jgi:RuvB-like protein 1 (pontin 52)
MIRTLPYTLDEIRLIIRLRTKTEALTISDSALDKLAEQGEKTSLRYALQLMMPAVLLPRFLDVKASRLEMLTDVVGCFLMPGGVPGL